jgi:hypothetical protein
MKKINLIVFALIVGANIFANDVLTLNNNMIFEGKVNSIDGDEIVFIAESNTYTIPAADIYSIEFGDKTDEVYTEYLAQTEDSRNPCQSGKLDAEMYHGKKGGHFILGVLFGPFAMIGTALSNPTPERGRYTELRSRNKDMFNDPEYLSCYKKKAKGQLIGAEALGWGAWILLLLIL